MPGFIAIEIKLSEKIKTEYSAWPQDIWLYLQYYKRSILIISLHEERVIL